jgi:hypothetical protein
MAVQAIVRAAPPVEQTITREEGRTQKIGDQTQTISKELEAIVQDLEINRLLTGDETADFTAARDGMDAIAKKEVQSVLEGLIAARQALERARRQESLRGTIKAQEQLIGHLTEELVRVQYRSQLRHLVDRMRAIVSDERQAVRVTQNAAIELAATDSDELKREIRDQVAQTQDGVGHDWTLARDQVALMVARYQTLPFVEVLKKFRARAQELPVESKLAETRGHLRGDRYALAVSGQRELSAHFLELLKILQEAGLSPAEQRSALDELIEKTEQALRDQQDLHVKTETLGQDLTEPLRNELAQAEDQLAAFARDLAQEADQVLKGERPAQPAQKPDEKAAGPQGADKPQPQARDANAQQAQAKEPAGAAQADTPKPPEQPDAKKAENPWEQPKPETPEQQATPLTTEAAKEVSGASKDMSNSSDQLHQNRPREAARAQEEAINHLAQALAEMRNELEQAMRRDQFDSMSEMMQANEALNEIGKMIEEQQRLMDQTQQSADAQAKAAKPGEPQGEPQKRNGDLEGPPAPADLAGQEAPAPSPAELSQPQSELADRAQQFGQQMQGSPAAQPMSQAASHMDQAAAQLGQSQPKSALPRQNEALEALRDAERQAAKQMADALQSREAAEWLDQMGDLDGLLQHVEQMAGQAEALPQAPAPEMAGEAQEVSGEMSEMAGQPPMGPAMASQMQQGSKMMQSASGQLEQGQTGQAAGTMWDTAKMLRQMRNAMSSQMMAAMQSAQAQMAGEMQGQAASSQQLAAAAAAGESNQPATQPSQSKGKGQGMRGLGPTDTKLQRAIEKDFESGQWSRLPEGEREEILQALKEKYPARYERALIRYYRNLSRVESGK